MLFREKETNRIIILLISIFIIFSGVSYSDEEINAEFVGRTIFTAEQVNDEGFFIEVKLNGANFKSEISEIDRKLLIDNLEVDIDDGHIRDNQLGNKKLLENIQEKNKNVLVRVGSDSFGNPMNSVDRFLSYERGIPEELNKNGEVFINEQGNLVIKCNSEYFKNLTNNIIYTNGGVPIGYGDLPIYVNIPKSIIDGFDEKVMFIDEESEETEKDDKQMLDSEKYIRVDGYYCIVEMKAKVEIFEYDDKDARENKDIKRVHQVNDLTEKDIRAGGKLLKLTILSRNGPTSWSVPRKLNPKFINNSFRTGRDYFERDKNNPELDKILSKWGGNLEPGNKLLSNWNGYWMTDIKRVSHEKSIEEIRPMYFFVEFPVIKDFNIDETMIVYVNLLAGMGGGTGKSNEEGEPFWGMDGRLSFMILSGDDSDITTPKQDNAGNDEGFKQGQGTDFGNEKGVGSGSDEENLFEEIDPNQQNQASKISRNQNERAQRIEISEPNSENNSIQNKLNIEDRDKENSGTENSLNQKNNISEDPSQGSAGEGLIKKESPKKIYDVSDQIVDETSIEKIEYEYEKYIVGIMILIIVGAITRYITYSRYIY